jgi:hypothetical protein
MMKSIVYAIKKGKKTFIVKNINAGIKWRMERIQRSRNSDGGGILEYWRKFRFEKRQVMENGCRIGHRIRSYKMIRIDRTVLEHEIAPGRGARYSTGVRSEVNLSSGAETVIGEK